MRLRHQYVVFITFLLVLVFGLVQSRQISFSTGSIDTESLPSLHFHTQSHGLSSEQFATDLLYIVQVNQRYVSQFARLLARQLVTFVPTDIFVIKTNGEFLTDFQSKYSENIIYVQVLPQSIKQSARLQHFLAAEAQVAQNSNILDEVLFSLYADKTDLLESLSDSTAAAQQHFRKQSPASIWQSNNAWVFPQGETPYIDSFVSSLVRESAFFEFLGTPNEEDEQTIASPRVFRGLSTFDPLSELVGLISNAGTHHIQALMTASAQQTDQFSATADDAQAFTSAFSVKVQEMHQVVNAKHQSYVENMLTSLSASPKSMGLTSTMQTTQATKRVHSVFNKSNLNIDSFVQTLTANMFAFANVSPQSLSSQSKSEISRLSADMSILSTLPFNVAFEFSKRPNTVAKGVSSIPLSYLHAQLQSPLFTTDSRVLSQAIASRVSQLYDHVYLPQAQQSIHEAQSNAQSVDLQFFKSKLAAQYKTYQDEFALQAQSRRDRFDTNTRPVAEDLKLLNQDNLQGLSYDNNQLTLATLSQYIDTLLFSLFETHNTARVAAVKAQGAEAAMKALSMQDAILLVSAFVDTQLQYLNELQTDIVTTLSAHQDVHFVDLQLPVSVSNKHARWSTLINQDKNGDFGSAGSTAPTGFDLFGPYAKAGIDGTGVVLGASDTGIDVYSCFFIDSVAPEFQSGNSCYSNHSTEHKKIKSYCAYYDAGDVLGEGHGSHVAGTIAGFQRFNTGAVRRTADYDNGIAFGALLAFFDIGDNRSQLSLPNDLSDIFRHGYAQGARIHSNSWGCSISRTTMPMWACNAYDISAQQMDQYLYEHQDFTILMAAGNDGDYAYGSVGSTSIAKNVITVGALAPSRVAAEQFNADNAKLTVYTSNPPYFESSDVVASFSSSGPTFDDRIKPDITTPGQYISSARSGTASGTESCQTLTLSGTSMATPATAAVAGLMQQMLTEGRQHTGVVTDDDKLDSDQISNSLIKSLLINSAQTVKYRGIVDAAVNMPEAVQTTQQQTKTYNSIVHTNILLGQFTPVDSDVGTTAYAYFQSTSTSSVLSHVFRVMVLTPCAGSSLTIVASTQGQADVTYKFNYEAETAPSRQYIDLTSAKANPTFLKLTATDGSCPSSVFIVGILEFAATSVANAPRYREIDCDTTVNDFPLFALTNFATPNWVYSCPPAPACTDVNTNGQVSGTNYYSLESPVCKMALHGGTVNATQVNLTGEAATTEIASGTRQFVRTAIGLYTQTRITLKGANHNGISSSDFAISPGDLYTITIATGSPFEYKSGTTTTTTNSFLYLQPLPNAPNAVSGFGKTFLGSVLPLHQNLPAGTTYSNSRQLIIFTNQNKDGDEDATKWVEGDAGSDFNPESAKYSALTHSAVQSYCFLAPPTASTFVNSYSYQYVDEATSATKTSPNYSAGPDDLRVTLSWYDFPGSNLANKILINDLDLYLFAPDGAEYRGNDRADHRNNVERVVINTKDDNTAAHVPGMYCAVVHANYVPMGIQRYSLVANGRGIEQCGKNPLPDADTTMSGEWTLNGSPTCTGAGSTVSGSTWASQADIRIRQGGNCFTMHAKTTAQVDPSGEPTKSSAATTIPSIPEDTGVKATRFRNMRLSSSKFEEGMDFDQASSTSVGSILPTTRLAVSGFITSEGNLSGKHMQAIPALPLLDMTGSFNIASGTLSITLNDSSQSCVFNYQRTGEDFGDQQYSFGTTVQVLEAVPVTPSSAINHFSLLSLFTSLLIALMF